MDAHGRAYVSLLPPCTTIGDQIAQALAAANDFNNRINELNSAIEAARAKFWKAFPNGPGFDQAEKEFLAALWQKDVYYLMLTTVTGMNGNILGQVNVIGLLGGQVAPEDINKFPTNMDHGIRPYAFPSRRRRSCEQLHCMLANTAQSRCRGCSG